MEIDEDAVIALAQQELDRIQAEAEAAEEPPAPAMARSSHPSG